MIKNSSKAEDRLGDFTTDLRVLVISLMALVVGAISALVAFGLVWLIGVMTNLAFYQRLSATFVSPPPRGDMRKIPVPSRMNAI